MGHQISADRPALERARGGDEWAFRELVEPHRRELHVHCYRMLGSLVDAEDAVQETLLAAWRGLDGFAGRSSLRAWLYRIATNCCLNVIRLGRRRPLVEPVAPFAVPAPTRHTDVPWLQPCPDDWLTPNANQEPGPATRYLARETVELAFIVALQRLPPRQTAAVLLCDVLGFAPGEIAAMLGASATAIKGVLQRGRRALSSTGSSAAESLGTPGCAVAEREERVARRLADAFTADDIDAVVALLTDDAWLAMPPAPHEYHGRRPIAAFLHASVDWRPGRHLQMLPTRANGQPAFGCYLADPGGAAAAAAGILVLTVSGEHVRAITRFLDIGLFPRFGLPDTLRLAPASGAFT